MHEQEIKVQSEGAVLAGTLCAPDAGNKYPAVLMVHGSGPLDRNENMKGQKLNIFNTLAHALAAQGIASFRYDKRGCGASSGAYMSAGHSDLIADATRCLDALTESEGVDKNRLYILGHSEGCIIAPQISHHRPLLAGLILLCPFFEKVEALLLRQAAQFEQEVDAMRGMSGFFYQAMFKLFGRPLKNQPRLIGKLKKTDSPVVRVGLVKVPAKSLRELLALDPESVFAATSIPMLLIAGEKDLQCEPGGIFRIAETAQGPAETLMVKDMTHMLRLDKNSPALMSYPRLIKEPVEKTVIDKTIQWVQAGTIAED